MKNNWILAVEAYNGEKLLIKDWKNAFICGLHFNLSHYKPAGKTLRESALPVLLKHEDSSSRHEMYA